MEKLRKNLSHPPDLIFTSSDEKENKRVWHWSGLIAFYVILFAVIMIAAISNW